ncbi:uncharacterized protein KGF55_002836 [Candida pseudojiufengensis]|uniref:uncharacterized protein n=1 Tax=Candida pseudojiufengensis TaxID=497109 RepID=UPI0022255E54|nr:uncharacterized protein KGF55_002836 [Candida pseudojiufengensis]KAI5963044.1 hypothetical protein KGF55_002836 [Candida pseudojiufengensis]
MSTTFTPDQYQTTDNEPTEATAVPRSDSWPSPSTTITSPSSTHTSSNDNSYSFIGNTPSSILFFVALAVGVFIGFLFIYFTIRYFVRSKYGIAVIPIGRRGISRIPGGSGPGSGSGGGSGGLNEHAFAHIFTTNEIQEQLNRNDYRYELVEQTLSMRNDRNNGRNRRRRRRRKMKKLSEIEVEKLFPKKTYLDWLEGGKERDVEHRDGILEEEPLQQPQEQEQNNESINSLYTAREENEQEIELKNIKNNNITYIEQDITDCKTKNDDHSLHFDSGSCAICLEIIENDEIVRGLICGHVFHAICLDPWLTKRRACCPMCKRDYRFKRDYHCNDNDENNNSNNNVNDGNDLINDLTQVESDRSLDFEEIRNDPAIQALLQDLIPIDERVRIILNDENYSHLNLDERGKEISKKKYGHFLKRLMWKFFGITKNDLYNWAVMEIVKKYRRENSENQQHQDSSTGQSSEQEQQDEQQQQSSESNASEQQRLEVTRETVENRV